MRALAKSWNIGEHHLAIRFFLVLPFTAARRPISCRITRATKRSAASKATTALHLRLLPCFDDTCLEPSFGFSCRLQAHYISLIFVSEFVVGEGILEPFGQMVSGV